MTDHELPGDFEELRRAAKYFLDTSQTTMKTDGKVPKILKSIVQAVSVMPLDLKDPSDYEFVADLAQGLLVLESLRATCDLQNNADWTPFYG